MLSAATSALAGPISGTVESGVYALTTDGVGASDHQFASWSGVPTGLTANASATATDATGRPTTVFSNGSAAWALDGRSGTFDMTWGWNAHAAQVVDDRGAANNWAYTFMADTNGWFDMSYDIVGTGDVVALCGFFPTYNFDSVSGVPPSLNVWNPNESGAFEGAVTAGQIYTVTLMNNANEGAALGYSITANGSATGHFAWSIKSVPDAGCTLLLLGAGLAAILGLRRKLRT